MELIQTQEQKLVQQQRLTQQQMMVVRMLEMPLAEFEQAVKTEIDDNPALEVSPDENAIEPVDSIEPIESTEEQEERQSELDSVLERMTSDDELQTETWNLKPGTSAEADYEEITYGNQISFYDTLKEQMGELELTDKQQQMMEYIIGSLDNDGLLRKSLDTLGDELAIYQNVNTTEKELEEVLELLQSFDPAGIGARSLQECLLLQIDRKRANPIRLQLREIIADCFDDLMSNRWEKIIQQKKLSNDVVEQLKEEVLRLNPKPGASLGETEGRNVQQITPDFIVDTADDGTVTFSLNRGRVPDLYVSHTFTDMLAEYQHNKSGMNRQMKEAFLYAKEKVDRARNYIEAIKQRRHTLYVTMKTIIDFQLKFFQDGDEGDIRPMVLKDVADRTGLDISTISRVCNVKYCQTRWGTYRLRHFFNEGLRTEAGETLSTRKVKQLLKELIDKEDKSHPLNDDILSSELKKQGYPVARRTVAKYREQLGIPISRLRKTL
jgi:RNA polymerase sigma-54 factor